MSDTIRLITRETHGNKRWLKPADYRFAATTTVAPLAAPEIAKAIPIFPLAFIETAGTWSLVAVLGLTPGRNLFVAPSGQWIGHYMPAAFRGHPFRLGKSDRGELSLLVDEASGLVVEGNEGMPFFDENGSPTPETRQFLDFLVMCARSREAVGRACAALVQHFVLEPWPLTLKDGDQQRQVSGLHRVNEAALNKVSDEAFLALRRAGALPIAYAQLLSMGNLAQLAKLAQAHGQATAAQSINLNKAFGLADDANVDWSTVKWDE